MYVNHEHPTTRHFQTAGDALVERLERHGYEAYNTLFIDPDGVARLAFVEVLRPDRSEMTLDEIARIVSDEIDRDTLHYAPTDYDKIVMEIHERSRR